VEDKRGEQVLSCLLDPTHDGVRDELTAVSFVTIKVEVPMFGSLMLLSDTRSRLDDLFLRNISDTVVYAMKLSDGNRAFLLLCGRITLFREK